MGDAAKQLPARDPAWRARTVDALAELLLAAIRRPPAANDAAPAVQREPRCE